jgi:hypothetical protein
LCRGNVLGNIEKKIKVALPLVVQVDTGVVGKKNRILD